MDEQQLRAHLKDAHGFDSDAAEADRDSLAQQHELDHAAAGGLLRQPHEFEDVDFPYERARGSWFRRLTEQD